MSAFFLPILIVVAAVFSLGAWYNTRLIIKDLDEIKRKMGIEEDSYSRQDDEFDRD